MWVKFHDHRRQGFWSGVPRAYRFVLLELELLCRPGSGVVELPPGKDPISRTVEMLGGRRREARQALRFLTSDACGAVLYRSPNGLQIDANSASTGRLLVVIPSWNDDHAVSSSAQRMRDLRSKRKQSRHVDELCDASLPSPCDANGDALEKRREEKRRSPTSLVTRAGAREADDDDEASDEQTAGYLGVIKDQGLESRPRQQHPRAQGYSKGLLSPQALAVHRMLTERKLPVNDPVGFSNYIAGKLGIQGHNQLTLDRVAMMLDKVTGQAAARAAASGGAGPTSDEIASHVERWLSKDNAWWKAVEAKQAQEKQAAAAPDPPELKLYRASKEEAENDPWSPANRAKHRQQQLAALDAMDRKAREKAAAAIAAEEQRLDP